MWYGNGKQITLGCTYVQATWVRSDTCCVLSRVSNSLVSHKSASIQINQHQLSLRYCIAVSPAERCPWKTARWSAVSQRSPSLCWVWRSTSAPAAISTCTAYERKSPVSVSSPSEYWCNPCLLLHGEHKSSSWWQQSSRSWGQQTSACFSPFHQKIETLWF